MAMDQSALSELLEALKAAGVDERVRIAAQDMYQALIDAEAEGVISAGVEVDLLGPLERRHPLQRVFRHVDEHGAGATGRGKVEGLGDRARDLIGIGDEVVVLGDRHRDAADVGFLERIGADRRAGHLAGDRHHGHGVHVRIGDRRDEVGRARTAGRHADADSAGGGGVSLGGMASGLLVAHEDVADLGGVHEGVVGGQDRTTGDAEGDIDAGVLHGPDQALGPGHPLVGGAHLSLISLSLR